MFEYVNSSSSGTTIEPTEVGPYPFRENVTQIDITKRKEKDLHRSNQLILNTRLITIATPEGCGRLRGIRSDH